MPNLGIKMPRMGIRKKAAKKGRFSGGVGVANALFTRTQQRLLTLLFGQPTRSFFATELIALTGSGSGAIQRELGRLADSGLATVSRVGNQKHFQANASSPVFHELCGIVRKTVGLADPLRRALLPLSKTVDLALIFGSFAKGTDTSSSDIDLLLVSNELTLERVYAALESTERQLGRKISVSLYTPREFERRRHVRNSFMEKVLTGEHIMLIGTEDGAIAAR